MKLSRFVEMVVVYSKYSIAVIAINYSAILGLIQDKRRSIENYGKKTFLQTFNNTFIKIIILHLYLSIFNNISLPSFFSLYLGYSSCVFFCLRLGVQNSVFQLLLFVLCNNYSNLAIQICMYNLLLYYLCYQGYLVF